MSDLAEFLKQKKLKEDQAKVDWGKTKADWLDALNRLFQLVKGWLGDSLAEGFVKLQDTVRFWKRGTSENTMPRD